MASLLSVQTFILMSFLVAIGLLVATWCMLRSQRISRRFQSLEAESRGLVKPLRRIMPRFRDELARNRRYQRSLSTLVIQLSEPNIVSVSNGNGNGSTQGTNGNGTHAPNGNGTNGNGSNASGANDTPTVTPLWALAAGNLIQESLRACDLLGWDVVLNRYVAFLPETNLEKAQMAADRLLRLIHQHVPVRVSIGLAVFQADGVTVDDLMKHATERCKQNELAAELTALGERNRLRDPNARVSIKS